MLDTGYAISFPIFHGRIHPGLGFAIEGEILGTAFALGGDYMLTAGHVAEGLLRDGELLAAVVIAHPTLGMRVVQIAATELLGSDLALLRVHFGQPDLSTGFHRFKWVERELEAFATVRTVGYAYGIHRVNDRLSYVVRGFQGHIVSGLLEFLPLGSSGKPFPVYELSFAAPRGLSGAPLLNPQGSPTIHGVVIGNSSAEMLVFSSTERVAEGEQVTSVERYEAMQLGIAVTAREVLLKASTMLDMTIKEHLRQYDLLLET